MAHAFDCILTNPPYSLKDEWLERCSQLGNRFEMFDSNAVVFALVHNAINGNEDLRRGIERTGSNVWPEWLAIYHLATPQQTAQLALEIEDLF